MAALPRCWTRAAALAAMASVALLGSAPEARAGDPKRLPGAGNELGTAVDRDGRHPDPRMADDVGRVVAVVDPRLEEDHALARDLRPAEAPDQLLRLAAEHGTADDLDPPHGAANERAHSPYSFLRKTDSSSMLSNIRVAHPCTHDDSSIRGSARTR